MRMLQRIVGRQLFIRRCRQGVDDLAVRIGHDRRRPFVAVQIDQQRAHRFGAKVDAERDFLLRRHERARRETDPSYCDRRELQVDAAGGN